MSIGEQTVFIVDDDADVLGALSLLLYSAGLPTRCFSSAQDFLDEWAPEMRGCLILDIRMSDINGLELQQRLEDKNITLPIIFITGHGEVSKAVQAMKNGALDFLQKPFPDQMLLDSVFRALEINEQGHQKRLHDQAIRGLIAKLTNREGEIMEQMVKGHSSKVIALNLNISARTVEIHRAKVMAKMHCKTLAQLVQVVMQVT